MISRFPQKVEPALRTSISACPALRGIAWMVFSQVLFSLMGVFTRLSAQNVPWQEIALVRFGIGAAVPYVMAKTRGAPLTISNKKLMWTRSITGTLSALSIFYVWASPKIPLGDAVTLTSIGPVFVVLLSWPLLKEHAGRLVWCAVPIAFCGIMLVLKPSFHVAYSLAAVAIVGSFFYSLAMISLRQIGPGESSEAVVMYFLVFAALVALCISVPVWKTPDPTTGLYLLLSGLSGGFGQIAMTRAYSLDRAARVSALNYLGIIFTNLLAIPVFGNFPGFWQITGTGLVILSGLFITLSAQKERILLKAT